jgi:hypothetical protein
MSNYPHLEDKLQKIVSLGVSAVYRKEIKTVLVTYSQYIKHVSELKVVSNTCSNMR